jgi:three-Cys-motif partner protein
MIPPASRSGLSPVPFRRSNGRRNECACVRHGGECADRPNVASDSPYPLRWGERLIELAGRGWGPWTQIKLDALEDYLSAFTKASQSARGTVYLDLFAGAFSNKDRLTGAPIMGSPYRALSVAPPFSRVYGFELQEKTAAQLKAKLREAFPDRDITITPGDCNITTPQVLRSMETYWRKKPTFAMIDQFMAEVHWDTIRALARHRLRSAPTRPVRKSELWLYFGDSFIPRGLGSKAPGEAEAIAARVDRMYGNAKWRMIKQARDNRLITGRTLKAELVNLMRWQREKDLGYAVTVPLEFINERGGKLYTVIFATDHPVGEKIMRHIFKASTGALDRMVKLRRARDVLKREDKMGVATGQEGLFNLTPDEAIGNAYPTTEIELLGPPQEPDFYGYDEFGH